MRHRCRPLWGMRIVITGASSGIGLATARRAARGGADVVLAARNEPALKRICAEINTRRGGRAVYAVADVGKEDELERVLETAVSTFGGLDTWVNNAGVVVFSRLEDIPTEDHQRLFQTNYWGTVFGSLAAARHLKHRPDGGSIITIASINAAMPVPILGAYSASKAAVQAFSDVLRMELLKQKAPIDVTVINPSGVATPISDHGLSHLDVRGRVMPPLYDPEIVARTILVAAQRPLRDVVVGGSGRATAMARNITPELGDRVIARLLPRLQSSRQPKSARNNLHSPGEDGQVYRGGRRGGIPFSPYTCLRLHGTRPLTLLRSLTGLAILMQLRLMKRALMK